MFDLSRQSCEPAKVVISRKGFDSRAGGSYSPFDPQTGAYMVLPIPMDEKERRISNNLKYKDVKIQRSYLPGIQADNLQELMRALEVNPSVKGEHSEYAHLDPWLGPCPWLTDDSDHRIGAFGQVDGAQTHLHNQKVGVGSLFLFFSRFTPVPSRENRVVPSIGPEQLKARLYFIYGWLKVGKIIREFDELHELDRIYAEELMLRHPHATSEYFSNKGNNTIYIADRYMLDGSSEYSGCGFFRRLSETLLLTATYASQRSCSTNWIPSRWKMPPGFSLQTCRSNFADPKYWKDMDSEGSYLVETGRWQWQEAVFEQGGEFYEWLHEHLLPEMPKLHHAYQQSGKS